MTESVNHNQLAAAPFTLEGAAPDAGVAEILTLVARTQHTIRIAGALVKADRPLDLSGLDNAVGLICAKALDLPPLHSHALRSALAVLLADCAVLGEALRHAPLASSRQKAATCPSRSQLS